MIYLSTIFQVYAVDCQSLEREMFSVPYTTSYYEKNIQKINGFYNSGCKRYFQNGGEIDKNYALGMLALITSSSTTNKEKYLQTAYNYFLKSY